MPATEQTWRNQGLLHVLFAVTGALMLGATIWMFGADHAREWKTTQRTFVDVETRVNTWRDQALAAETEENHEALMTRLLAIRSQPAPAKLLEDFQAEAVADAERRQAPPPDFSRIERLQESLTAQSATATTLRTRAAEIRALLDRQRAVEQLQMAQTAASAPAAADGAAGPSEQEKIAADAKKKASEAAGELASLLAQASESAAQAATKAAANDLAAAKDAVQIATRNFAAAFQRADQEATQAETAAAAERDALLGELRRMVANARFVEDNFLRDRKFAAADYDQARATRDLYVRDNRSKDMIDQAQARIDAIKRNVDDLTRQYQAASDHRRRLQNVVANLSAEEDAVRKEIADNRADMERLRKTIEDQQSTYFVSTPPYLGKRWLELPILDAFNSPRKISNLWTDGLTIQYGSFSKVRRFDRCTTCHQAIDKTMPGSAVEPAYEHAEELQLVMLTPSREEQSRLKGELDKQGNSLPFTTDRVYGLQLADHGLVKREEVAVAFVRNDSLAAGAALVSTAGAAAQPAQEILESLHHTRGWNDRQISPPRPGLLLGDVLVRINNNVVRSKAEAERLLLQTVKWGEPLTLTVRRGVPHPYASHPRLDLFVGSLSPHPVATFGCTVCHEGQGSGTAFQWASHSPNTPRQAEEWRQNHGWFYNHHWIFPMYPARFAESTCIKCHHDVTELEPSERFPEPPAPKVVRGHELIATYGCFGCHEINGYDGPHRRIGPDLRLEPNFFAAAQQLLHYIPPRETWLAQQAQAARQELEAATAEGGLLHGVDLAQVGQLEPRQAELAAELQQAERQTASLDEAGRARVAQIRGILGPLATAVSAMQRLAALEEMSQLAAQLVDHPEDDATRRRLHRLLTQDIELAKRSGTWEVRSVATEADEATELQEPTERATAVAPRETASALDAPAHKLEAALKDVEIPGSLRKAGPALRFVKSKNDAEFLTDWVRDPRHFRPNTRMPKFFAQDNNVHLQSPEGGHTAEAPRGNAAEKEEAQSALQVANDFEPVEILGMSLYLLDRSQRFDYLEPPAGMAQASEEERLGRGKMLFETRGCLACHTHNAFPTATEYRYEGDIVQGPDLSGIGSKFDPQRNPDGPKWLYTWIKEPTRYHPRTKMPDLFLDPYEDAAGNLIDPAADIVAFLMSEKNGAWRPTFDADFTLDENHNLTSPRAKEALHGLALEYLSAAFFQQAAERYYENGVPEDLRNELKGAEIELVSNGLNDRQRLIYVGAKAIGKYGCYGCHDIPGFEDAKPIGTGLADWGRKDTSRLAFEHITHFLHASHGAHGGAGHGSAPAAGETHEPIPDFYLEALEAGHREGFIFQKLRQPRSYDYEKADNKTYNEWLRMPQFPFNNEEREQVITFVLGLVAEPPSAKFIYQPSPRDKAIQEGRRVLAKYNCGGCHVLEMEKWRLTFPPESFPAQPPMTTFSFVHPEFTRGEIADAQQKDRRGMLHGAVVGQPAVGDNGLPTAYDEFGDPLELDEKYDPTTLTFPFQLFEPTVLGGHVYAVSPSAVQVPARLIDKKYPAHGGYLARYLVPRVTEIERQTNPAAKAAEAWGWLPPPLVGEGHKVQSEWLYNFLINPYPIRPAVFLRMPRFNLSPAEAQALVDYFGAKDNANYPYDFLALRQPGVLESKDRQYRAGDRLDDAMKIVTNNAGCVKCHVVADFVPQGSPRAKAPNLADVYRRLRADYVRPWIAKPDSILPYTSMPVNIDPQTGFAAQGLYHGSPTEQVDALVDLLMNFDAYAQRKTSIAGLVQAANPAPPAEPPAAEEAAPPAEAGSAATSAASSEAETAADAP